MSVYTKNRDYLVSITRTVTDDDGNQLSCDHNSFHTLQDAIDALRKMYKNDKIMYEAIRNHPYGLICTRDECVDDKYSYSMYIRKREGSRKITCGIDNIYKYAAEAFCFDTDADVTQ